MHSSADLCIRYSKIFPNMQALPNIPDIYKYMKICHMLQMFPDFKTFEKSLRRPSPYCPFVGPDPISVPQSSPILLLIFNLTAVGHSIISECML